MKKFKFNIRGNAYDVQVHDVEDNVADIEVNGTRYNVEIEKEQKVSKTPKLVRQPSVPSSDSGGVKTSKPTAKKGGGDVKAPLPGTVLEIKCKPGDEVKIGDTLLVMEAMKMENDIKADRGGVVKAVKVNTNDSVLEGDVLVEIGGN